MFRLSTLWLQLGTALLLALFIAGCSSDESGDAAGDAPAAADTGSGGGDEAAGRYRLSQAFDMSIEVTSPVFSRIRRIPKQHTCPGRSTRIGQSYVQNYQASVTYDNTSPPLQWTGVPAGTVSIALVMGSDEVLDVRVLDPLPGAIEETMSHWVIWNIPADTAALPEAVASTTDVLAIGPNTRQGVNDGKTVGYSGPCPVPVTVERSGYLGTPKMVFSYIFHVYALDVELDLGPQTTRDQLLEAIDGHVLAGGEIKGEFLAKKNYKEN
jgi:Raf kinase inhibitor-like YbhB/YbcL family protein